MPKGRREVNRRRIQPSPKAPKGEVQDGDRTHVHVSNPLSWSNRTRSGSTRAAVAMAGVANSQSEASTTATGTNASDSGDESGSCLSDSQKLDFIIRKLKDMEDKLESRIFEVEKRIDSLPTKESIKVLEDKIDDQENRMRRNNVVIHNVPEKAEGNDCAKYVRSFIVNHMKLEVDSTGADRWEIERAHRSPTGPPQQQRAAPRVIVVKFLRYQDRVLVLKAAPKRLQNNPFTPVGSTTTSRVYISDDVSERVRKQRKKLVVLKKKILEKWPTKKVFIPPTVPAFLLRENEEGKLVRMFPGDRL